MGLQTPPEGARGGVEGVVWWVRRRADALLRRARSLAGTWPFSTFADLPIRRKLTWVYALSTGVALSLACFAFIAYDLASFRQRMVHQLATQAEIVGDNSAAAILFDDHNSAMLTMRALKADPHITVAVIYAKNDEPFANYLRYDARELPQLPERSRMKAEGYLFRPDALVVFRDIVFDAETIGTLCIVSDLTELTDQLWRYVGIVLVVFVLSIVAVIPLLSGLQRVIANPILHLVDRAHIVTREKNYAVRAKVMQRNDELGELIAAFNEMLSQIQQRDAALERARDEAQAANRAKDEFLAVISHELRTPLTPVLGWARMLRGGQLDAAGVVRAGDVIERNVRAQAKLIEDLLDVSRIISGKQRLEVSPVDLLQVIEAVVETLQLAADAKGVRIETVLDKRANSVAGDPARLQQIIWNLLSNAIKFTPKGGLAQIELRRVASHVEIAVSDTGEGIAPEFLPHVFDRFRQGDSTSTRTYGGLGLGLAIVRHLVELHGGQVHAASPGRGQGSTFTVQLPISVFPAVAAQEQRPRPATDARPPTASTPNLKGLRILVVDDEPDTLEALRLLLEQRGAKVHTAISAARALEDLEAWRPEVLVSDIGMPREDGYDLIRNVRALGPDRGGRVPAVALTAYAREEDRAQILAAGFQVHIRKPAEPTELLAAIARLVGGYEGRPA